MLQDAVAAAGIADLLDEVLSVDQVGVFQAGPGGLSSGHRAVWRIAIAVLSGQRLGCARCGIVRLPKHLGQSGRSAGSCACPARPMRVIHDLAALPTLLGLAAAKPAERRPVTAPLPIGSPMSWRRPNGCAASRRRTPLLESEALNALVGGRCCSSPSRCSAPARSSSAAPTTRSRCAAAGVVAYSSGNHAQGVALAARLLGIPATIVMPADAPRDQARRHPGAGRRGRDLRSRRATIARGDRPRDRRPTGAVLVRPYDDPLIMAGQGTLGLELAEQAAGIGGQAGCGPGLLRRRRPGRRLRRGADAPRPRHRDPRGRAGGLRRHGPLARGRLANGERAPAPARSATRLLAPMPGELTFAVNSRLLAGGRGRDRPQVAAAMRLAFRHLKLVVEPGGAVASPRPLPAGSRRADRTIGSSCPAATSTRSCSRGCWPGRASGRPETPALAAPRLASARRR